MSTSTKLRCALTGLRPAIVILGTDASLPTARLSKLTLWDKRRIKSSGPRTALLSSTRSYACMVSAALSDTSTVLSINVTDSTTDATLQLLKAFSVKPNPRQSLSCHTHLLRKPFRYSPTFMTRAKKKRSPRHAWPVKCLSAISQILKWALKWSKTLSSALWLKNRA